MTTTKWGFQITMQGFQLKYNLFVSLCLQVSLSLCLPPISLSLSLPLYLSPPPLSLSPTLSLFLSPSLSPPSPLPIEEGF